MNTRFAGAGTLSTVIDLLDEDLHEVFKESVSNEQSADRRLDCKDGASLSVFAFPKFFPGEPEEPISTNIPTQTALSDNLNLYTGWVEIEDMDEHSRNVALKNSTTLLYQTTAETFEGCQDRIYQEMRKLPEELTYRNDIGQDLNHNLELSDQSHERY